MQVTKEKISTDKVFTGQDRLKDFAVELKRQLDNKKDFKVPSEVVPFGQSGEDTFAFDLLQNGRFNLNDYAHHQLASKLDIPRSYYNRMREVSPELLTHSVNHWMRKEPKDLLIRILDGQVRAVLSDRFRALDNYNLMNAILPVVQDQNLKILESALTDRRLYLKAVFEEVQGEVAVGDVVQSGIIIQNSEVGAGTLSIGMFLWRLVCLNGMVGATSLRQYHLGKDGNGDEGNIREFISSETRQLEDKAFFSKIGDICRATISQESFNKELEKFKEANERPIKNPERIIEVIDARFGFSKPEEEGILYNLVQGGNSTQWGLANAVTATAKDSGSYDRKVELETIGHQIVKITADEWVRISNGSSN